MIRCRERLIGPVDFGLKVAKVASYNLFFLPIGVAETSI